MKKTMGPPPTGKDDFLAPSWRAAFAARGLADFERLWRLDLPPLDAANTERGGVSTVSILVPGTHTREASRLVVKRQRNHQSHTWRHPLRGIPTTQKEFINIRRFARCGLAPVAPVFFAKRRDDRGIRAILITEFLEGYRSFDTLLEQWATGSSGSSGSKDAILRQAADLVSRLHRAGFRHNCLYPKHLFVDIHRPSPDVRLIDLEKAGRAVFAHRRMTRDLGAFFRRSAFWSSSDQRRFLVYYHGAAYMTPRVERAWRRIRRAMARKRGPGAAPRSAAES
ncbi:MAG: hypothetical protein JJV98_01755 [Desulfosarcina sp.]|nr:hypothetical protein [Desulfobacterales bacterium]